MCVKGEKELARLAQQREDMVAADAAIRDKASAHEVLLTCFMICVDASGSCLSRAEWRLQG